MYVYKASLLICMKTNEWNNCALQPPYNNVCSENDCVSHCSECAVLKSDHTYFAYKELLVSESSRQVTSYTQRSKGIYHNLLAKKKKATDDQS